MGDRAVVFVATGDDYLKMAANAAKSLRQTNNEIKIVLYTDTEIKNDDFTNVFITDAKNSRELRISALIQSQYSRCLHLDVDTYIYEDVCHIFTCLDRFDLAVTQDPIRNTQRVPCLPECFPEYNGGVILYRNTPVVNSLFEDWLQNYRELGYQADQPAFRKALYESDGIQYFTLPREYNCRPKHPGFLSRNENAKIIHGRNIPGDGIQPFQHTADLSEVAEVLNASRQERVHFKRNGFFTSRLDVRENKQSYLSYLSTVIQQNGIVATAKKIYDRFRW
jgi:hypothetical protein